MKLKNTPPPAILITESSEVFSQILVVGGVHIL
jgi:hypothetical protein